jgi:PAS domain-containing protein
VKDVIGKTDPELLTPETAEHVTLLKRKAIENNQQVREEVAIQYQGNIFTYDFTIEPLHNLLGQVIGVTNIVIDITERKKASEKLHKANEQIRIQSEELQVFNEELQTQTEELRVTNEALLESEKRFRTLAENSPEQVRFLETYYEIVFATRKTEKMEYQYTSPTGNEYCFSARIVPEFVDGKVTSILAIFHDITDIKKAELKLKETLDNLDKLVKERTAKLEKSASFILTISDDGVGIPENLDIENLESLGMQLVIFPRRPVRRRI